MKQHLLLQRLLLLSLLAFQSLLFGTAHAEKTDKDQKTVINADREEDDEVKQVRTFIGNVVLTQGTLIMKGTKLVVTTSPDGYDFATLYSPAGGAATMRQKRDGGPDLWMEGEAADKVTYDQKTSIATLYSNAKVRRLTGIKTTDESNGAYLSYNSQTEVVTGANTVTGESKPGSGRVTVEIQPHNHPDAKDK